MVNSISNITGSGVNGYNTATTSAPKTSASPVAKTAEAGLAQTAVTLSSDGNIVAMLGGAASSSLTYNAAGLLNSLVQAGAATSSAQTSTASSNPQSSAQNSTNQAIANTLPASSAASGINNSSGTLPGISTNASWASALKANPALAATVSADTFDQGIVGTL